MKGARVLGRFVLDWQLGQGAYGAVWAASDPATGERAAVKLLHPHQRARPSAVERFQREARVLDSLAHPGIARLLAWEVSPETAAIALELVEGRTVDRVIGARAERGAPFDPAEVFAVLDALADALGFAHGRGIVHRDLKPQNVMVRGADLPAPIKVLDFGLARLLETDRHDRTTAGRVMGSPLYMSPEQVMGEDAGPPSDVFALATIAFELLTLARAWARTWEDRPLPWSARIDAAGALNSTSAVFERVRRGSRPSVHRERPELSAAIDEVLAAAWSPAPSLRLASVTTFASELRAAADRAPRRLSSAVPETRPSLPEPEAVEPTAVQPKPLLESRTDPSLASILGSAESSGADVKSSRPRGLPREPDADDEATRLRTVVAPSGDATPAVVAPAVVTLAVAARPRSGLAPLVAVGAGCLALGLGLGLLAPRTTTVELPVEPAPVRVASAPPSPREPPGLNPDKPLDEPGRARPAPVAAPAAPVAAPVAAPARPPEPKPPSPREPPALREPPRASARPREPALEPALEAAAPPSLLDQRLAAAEAAPSDPTRLAELIQAIEAAAAGLGPEARAEVEASLRRVRFGGGLKAAREAHRLVRRAGQRPASTAASTP